MMASPTSEFGGDVHIPLCNKESCRDRLLNLSKALEEKHLTCVVEYNISGKYVRCFQEAFENCPYTIIHRCRHLWDKIRLFEKQFSAEETKIIAIDMSSKSKTRNDAFPRSNSGLNDFFAQYNVTVISDEKCLNTFILKIVQLYTKTVHIERQQPDLISYHRQDRNASIQGVDHEDKSIEHEEIFEEYQDILGAYSHVCVRESCVNFTEKEVTELSDFQLHGWAEWRYSLSRTKNTPHSKYAIHKALPVLFDSQKISELAYIASSCDADLQGEAMILLEMLMLRHEDDAKFSLKAQIPLESLLFEGLVDLCHKFTVDKDTSVYVPIQRISIIYMMVLSGMIMSCGNKAEITFCDMHFNLILDRCSILDEVVNELRVIVEDVNKKGCSQMKNTVLKFTQTSNPKLGERLWKENTAIQACVIVEIMKQMFKSLNNKNLELLHHYVRINCIKAAENNNMQSACMKLLIQCLTIFLSFGLKKMKHQDLQSTSEEALEIIKLYLGGSLTEDIYRMMQILLFDGSPVIQKCVFETASVVEGTKRRAYDKNQLPFLLNELERLLSPLLLIDGTWKGRRSCNTEGKWELGQGTFDGLEVLLRVHSPIVKSHRMKNETGCIESEDMYCNEMKVLQKLQHKNIIKMFAFQEGHIPLFYILEEHLKNNLQTALKHKRQNKDIYSQTTLLKFLIDTVAALEYCHSKHHVHCSLTAENLFIVQGTSVKLCGFHLCLELEDGRAKIDEKFVKAIPIRWTSPESLRDKEYTTASDIWMFGHLMYEVLTHGQLPYPHNEDVEDVSTKIRDGKISLPQEPYFRNDHYSLISECTIYRPASRPSIIEVRERLDNLYIVLANTAKAQTSIYSYDGYHKPSTENEKGMPDVNSSKLFEDQSPYDELEQIATSDTIMRFTLEDKYIFREKIVHKVTQNMAFKVENGKLSDVLSGVKICQNQGEVHHIECHVPRTCQGSLLELAFTRTLGTSLKLYLDCLLQVASFLTKLHKRSWILGDMCASHLYVEQTDLDLKVYVVSLAYLLPCEMKVIPENTHLCARAAPEVIRGGIFSPQSDVYCFGFLMWEVLTAFDHCQENVEQFMVHMESTLDKPAEEYKKKVSQRWEDTHGKPHCCPDSLFDLIVSCVDAASTRRITLNKVIEKLERICEELEIESVSPDSGETVA